MNIYYEIYYGPIFIEIIFYKLTNMTEAKGKETKVFIGHKNLNKITKIKLAGPSNRIIIFEAEKCDNDMFYYVPIWLDQHEVLTILQNILPTLQKAERINQNLNRLNDLKLEII